MKGQIRSVARIALMHGFIRFLHAHGPSTLAECADQVAETAIRGRKVKGPATRMRDFAAFAADLGLVTVEDGVARLTADGVQYAANSSADWDVSPAQGAILRAVLQARPTGSETLFALTTMLVLVDRQGPVRADDLANDFAGAVGQGENWPADATRRSKSGWALKYLTEMGCVEDGEEGFHLTAAGETVAAAVVESVEREGALAPDHLADVVETDLEALAAEEATGVEGASRAHFTNRYERQPRLRRAAIRIHGTVCRGCGFDFERAYGPHGRAYIEVHHLRPVSSLGENNQVDARRDMTVLCANCHRMVHRHRDRVLVLEELQDLVRRYAQG